MTRFSISVMLLPRGAPRLMSAPPSTGSIWFAGLLSHCFVSCCSFCSPWNQTYLHFWVSSSRPYSELMSCGLEDLDGFLLLCCYIEVVNNRCCLRTARGLKTPFVQRVSPNCE